MHKLYSRFKGGNIFGELLYKLGSSIAKHKWLTIFIWVILLAGIVTPLTINKPTFDNDITMSGIKSIDTNEKIEKEFNQDSEKANIRVVFKVKIKRHNGSKSYARYSKSFKRCKR